MWIQCAFRAGRLQLVDAHDSPREAAHRQLRVAQIAARDAMIEAPQRTLEEGLALVSVYVAQV